MKYRINAIIPFLISFLITTAAISGDKYKPLREISPYPTRKTITTIASTPNETTTQIQQPPPEEPENNAMKNQPKNEEVELQNIPTPQEAQLAREIDNIFSGKKTVAVKKPETHKVVERSVKRKKRHARIKAIMDSEPANPTTAEKNADKKTPDKNASDKNTSDKNTPDKK